MVKKSHFERFAKHYDFLTKILMLGTYGKVRARIVDAPRVESALDLCCGTGYVTGHVKAERVIALDMSSGMLKINREKNKNKPHIDLVAGDAFLLPFSDSSFDGIYCTLAAHEFKNFSDILGEVYRVLKKDGQLMLYDFSVPESFFLRHTYLPFLKHVVELGSFFVYDSLGWKSLLLDAGFSDIETETLYAASILIHARK
ncbi:MAG: class I SAM-dependent methyltransferase [Candidatus Hydrothermarchaeales archaeon]